MKSLATHKNPHTRKIRQGVCYSPLVGGMLHRWGDMLWLSGVTDRPVVRLAEVDDAPQGPLKKLRLVNLLMRACVCVYVCVRVFVCVWVHLVDVFRL